MQSKPSVTILSIDILERFPLEQCNFTHIWPGIAVMNSQTSVVIELIKQRFVRHVGLQEFAEQAACSCKMSG
jgi:hypothetical protein